MNKALLLLILILPLAPVSAQTLTRNDALKSDADYYLMEKEFGKAKTSYLNILKSEPDNADIKFKLGICYLNSEDEKQKAIPYLEEAVQKISEKYNERSFKETNAPIDALFLLGSAYRVNFELDKAIDAYNRYKAYLNPKDVYNLELINQYIRNCNLARDMLKNPVNMVAKNLGKPINTELPNFDAIVSGDGKTLLYTVPGRQGYEIYSSTFADTAWTTPRNITSLLGTGKYMKTSDLSNDGLTMLLVLDDPMNSDIYVSHYAKGKWSKVEPLGKEINSKSNETHASLSADGQTLYFTSNRKGGEGDLDIYRSELDAGGAWGKAINMGPIINTPFNEETPFVTDDGKTLYFSSEGHDGIGGYDVFRIDLSNPGASVVNLGYPLNTTDNDLFFVPFGDGTDAFYSFRGPDTYGGRDIYRVTLPPEETAVAQEEIVEEAVEEPVVETSVAAEAPVEEPVVAEAVVVEEPVEAPVEVPVAAEEPVYEDPVASAVGGEVTNSVPQPEPVYGEVPSVSTSTITGAQSYTVQFMALRRPVDLIRFQELPGVAVVYSHDRWYRYTLGNTTDRGTAEKMMTALIEKGYRDAFIRGKNISPRFTIQVMAVPGPFVDLTRFSNLPEISVTKGTDNFCRYTTGEFETKEAAIESLKQIRELGYDRAFVAKINLQQ